ncbi:MAG TPA: GNAT family N-acetyltransferase [Blastocatellia bacterium]|nr:GNAT family N-acetyltransferase [Blastocatellia bacterium]
MRTPRLWLRPFAPEDVYPVFDLYSSPRVMSYNVFPPFTRIEEASELLDFHAVLFATQRGIRWAITRPEDQELIGTCGYHNWRQRCREAELSYELSPDYWGRGLMSEALSSVIDFGLREMNLTCIRAKVMRQNTASIRLLEKFGFRPAEGVNATELQIQQGREVCWYELKVPAGADSAVTLRV